jgi:hypothetical protein
MDQQLCEWARCFFELNEQDRQVLKGLALVRRSARIAAKSGERRQASPEAAGGARTFVYVGPAAPLVLGR